jgi:hypothetical protein
VATVPACPRCAYDLSGEVARWSEACPLTGLCPECGLGVAWRDVLLRKYNYPEWLFETASARRLAALCGNSLLALRPARFWSRVKMNYPVRPVLAVFAGLAGCIGSHAALLVVTLIVCLPMMISARVGAGIASAAWGWPALWLWPRGFVRVMSMYSWWACIALLALVLMPWAMLLLPATLRRVQVRPSHLLRIWAYSIIGAGVIVRAPTLVYALLALVAFIANPTPGSGPSYRFSPWALGGFRGLHPEWGMLAMTLGLFAWPLIWWWAACRYYLRLPRPLLIASVLAVLCVLFWFTLAMVVWWDRAYWRLFGGLDWW